MTNKTAKTGKGRLETNFDLWSRLIGDAPQDDE